MKKICVFAIKCISLHAKYDKKVLHITLRVSDFACNSRFTRRLSFFVFYRSYY